MYNISFFVILCRISFKELSHTPFTMNNYKTTFVILGVAAALAIGVITTATSNLAYAKISSADTSCTNGGGSQPGGQQPTCTGGGLTQQTENQNPSGSAPPGQNK
jgi:hypothetical protein